MFENKKLHKAGIVSKVIVILYLIITVIPLIWIFLMSFKTQKEIMLEPIAFPETFNTANFEKVMETVPFATLYINSFKVLLVSIPVIMIFATLAAFAISRVTAVKPRIRDRVHSYFSVGFIIPMGCMLFPVYKLVLGMGKWDSVWGVILPHIGWAAPFSVMMLITAFNKIPSGLEEAAVLDGCNLRQLLAKVMIPMVRPTLVTILILNFIGIWNDYMYSRLILSSNENFTVALASMFFKSRYGSDYGLLAAGIIVMLIPQVIIFVALQKQIMAGVTAGAVKE